MKRIFISALGLFMAITAFSQPVTITENFDGNTNTFVASPASSWKIDKNYYATTPQSIRGVVPNLAGDSAVLESPIYDFTNQDYVLLGFRHICKVSPEDVARIEYRTDVGGGAMGAWTVLPAVSYLGKANINQYAMYGFNANSYPEWKRNDSLALPAQSWWKEEFFDVGVEVKQSYAQFRFVIRRGNTSGTQLSYGWLVDNIEITVAPHELLPPAVAFLPPLVKDTVYTTGPWEINAKVKTQTTAKIANPYLKYTATNNGTIIADDSILMTMVVGDSLWKAIIPQFAFGTEVVYSIEGRDMNDNKASDISGYVIAKPIHIYGDTSVALTELISPVYGMVIGYEITPIEVMLRNKGDSTLTAATIYRSINGVITTYPWTGNLAWDFEEQVSLGSYRPRMANRDTIRIWVSMPNGISDVVVSDDTLTIISFGCSVGMSGSYDVGQGGTFTTLDEALNTLRLCNPIDDITLQLTDNLYEVNWTLVNISAFMGNHTLTITSATRHPEDVVIRPNSGVPIVLNNVKNLVLEAITVDAAQTSSYAIQLMDGCSNIVINNCIVLASPTGSGGNAIHKDYAGSLMNLRITNCTISGGYYGIHLNGTTTNYYQNITIDSNIIRDQSYSGTYFWFVDFNSVSYNTVTARTANQGTTWYGFYFYRARKGGKIIGNKISANNPGINSQLYGLYINYADSALVANNEIYLNSSASATYGMYLYYSNNVNYIHNSVLLTGTGGATFRAVIIYVSTSATYRLSTYKNNLFIANGGATPYAVYLTTVPSATFDQYNYIGDNNYYSSGSLGYAGSIQEDLTAWKSVVPTDSNSVNKLPVFASLANGLELAEYDSLSCDLIPLVPTDIQGNNRKASTTMGCYQEVLRTGNGALVGTIDLGKYTVAAGEKDSIKIVFTNYGSTVLNSVNIGCSIDGTIQAAKECYFTKPLATLQSDTVTLSEITYVAGNMDLKIWINSLENGTLQDEYPYNDTIGVVIPVCPNTATGIISVGPTHIYTTITAAIQAIRPCGRGDITLLLEDGIYQENCDFSNLNNIMLGNTLTITSKTGKAENVIIRPTANVGIRMQNTYDVKIENITVDASTGTYGIQFTGACSNIVVDKCIILADTTVATTSQTHACIYKAGSTGSLSNLTVTNCTLTGGVSGVSLIGTTIDYCQNIRIDSNIITKQYYYSTNFEYVNLNSISHNHITPRTVDGYMWTGLRLSRTLNGNVMGNTIRVVNIKFSLGIYGMSIAETDGALLANNEVYINSPTSVLYGIRPNNTRNTDFIHNTVVIKGDNAVTLYGINITVPTGSYYNRYKNNIIMVNGIGTTYAIYLDATPSATFAQTNEIDYNNYYSSGNIGSAGVVCADLAAWKSVIPSDTHSVSSQPAFLDMTTNLKLADYSSFHCDLIPSIGTDIENTNRKSPTVMGCYEESLLNVNAALTEITGMPEASVIGNTDSIKVVLVNQGNTTLQSVNIGWSINGASQTKNYTFPQPLTTAQSHTIYIDEITYPYGMVDIKIWINSLDGGSLTDGFLANDTISTSVFACSNNPVTGIIPVGATSTFTTISDALQVIFFCGTGDITLLLDSGAYEENCDFSNLNSKMKGNHLTVTSKTGRADDVVIKPTSGAGITLSNTHNLALKAITVNVSSGLSPAILMISACTNIVVRDCKLFVDTISPSITTNPFQKAMMGVSDSLFLINNIINGGRRGIQLYGGTGTAVGQMGTNIIIDSNTISNQSQYAICVEYTDLISCSYNTVLSKTTAEGGWYGMLIEYSNGDIIGNRIIQRHKLNDEYAIYQGIHIFGLNNYSNPPIRKLIANNEIILDATGHYATSSGMLLWNSRVEVINNSIYVSGANISSDYNEARCIEINNAATNDIVIKNNNIVTTSRAAGAYPIYFGSKASQNLYDIDYNNYYAPTHIGYNAGSRSTMAAWQQDFPTDLHSVKVAPSFIDNTKHLEWMNYIGLSCPSYPNVTSDIRGGVRESTTVMGAYNGYGSSFDLGIQQIVCATNVLYPQPVSVKIEILNAGEITNVDSATFGWSVNEEIQTPYTWRASNPLSSNESIEIPIGSFPIPRGTNLLNIVVWIESVNNVKDPIALNDTAKMLIKVFYTADNLSIRSMEQLVPAGSLCTDDYSSIKINVENTGGVDYDFAVNPVTFSVRITNPEPFSKDTVVSLGEIKSGETALIELTDAFPIMVAGIYDIEIYLQSPIDTIRYDDTIRENYISSRFKIPIDEFFSGVIPPEFSLGSNNMPYQWQVIPQGTGVDTVVEPQFGTGMLAFSGSAGSMTTLATRQMDLSQTSQPSLSFWYFHDTVSSEDYTDVRITVDGGTTYETLLSLTKYNPAYGWRQYSMDLPDYAVNQCVILVFEAMEKSRNGDVTQYIDRIRITAKQDIVVKEILISPVSVCDLENKTIKVVMENESDPMLNYVTNPTTLTLEVTDTGQTYIYDTLLNNGSLGSFASDTITLTTDFNFAKGNYTLKAYFSSVLDINRNNDTLETSIAINPAMTVQVQRASGGGTNCLSGESPQWQEVTITNTGNMDLFDVELTLQIDTGETGSPAYAIIKETFTGTILAEDSVTYTFNTSYNAPWSTTYYASVTAYLSCDSSLANGKHEIMECVDIKDLRLINIDNPSTEKDSIENLIQVTVTLINTDDMDDFNNTDITVRITNSQDVQTETFTETIPMIDHLTLSTSYTFTNTYTVPNDSVYYLMVYTNSYDRYSSNDTLITRREAVKKPITIDSTAIKGIDGTNGFALEQNIPNPAMNSTRIDYNIPESGEVIFHVQSASGQLLYSKTIEAASGKNYLEFNTSTLAAGIYVYSIEYKGQRLVKRMSVQK
jgi:hypothetical protein